jgi:alanine racemase
MATLLVHKDTVLHNLSVLREQSGARVIPVLSGNAMGLGDCEMAALLSDAGVKLFAVSRIEEAQRVAASLPPDDEIILLTPYETETAAQKIIDLGLTAAVGSHESAVLLNGLAEKAGVKCRVHLLFDTGLGRCGFLSEETDKALHEAKYLKNLEVTGCFTELVDPTGCDKKGAVQQLKLFENCLTILKKADVNPGMTYTTYSAVNTKRQPQSLDAVLAGPVLYGRAAPRRKLGVQRAYKLISEVSSLRWLPAGKTVGEYRRCRVSKPVHLALIPIGHSDGLFLEKAKDSFRFGDIVGYRHRDFMLHFRHEQLCCEIAGKKAPVLGAVGRSAVAADVSSFDCKPGDVAVFDTDPEYLNSDIERRYI